MNLVAEKILFWDEKILRWERQRYEARKNSVQHRMRIARDLLGSRIRGSALLDLGCGSGRFLGLLEESEPRALHGIDYSESAIARAKSLYDHSFSAGDCLQLPLPSVDYVTGLGLLDWLSLGEIDTLFSKLKGTPFLFSFSERRFSLLRVLHFIFVLLSYGWKSKGYRPRYYSVEEISQIARRHGYTDLHIYRHPQLSFGTFLSSFPLDLDHFDNVADDYDSPSLLWRLCRSLEMRAIEKLLPNLHGKSALDACCGTGLYAKRLLALGARKVTAVDRSKAMVRRLRDPEITVRQGDVCEIETAERFDVVVCAGGLEFMKDPRQFFRAAEKMTKPDATLITLMPRRGLFGAFYRRYHRRHGLEVKLFDPARMETDGWKIKEKLWVHPFAVAVRYEK